MSGPSENREAIRGQVAQVLNDRELVVNRGSEHGVHVGMQMAVLNNKGLNIVDPETGEPLGSTDVPKVMVKVLRVDKRLSVAGTFRTFTTGGGFLASTLLGPRVEHTETLRTDSPTYKEELAEEETYVHIGDPVVQVRGDEFAGWGIGSS